jgi:hypothetical protein
MSSPEQGGCVPVIDKYSCTSTIEVHHSIVAEGAVRKLSSFGVDDCGSAIGTGVMRIL